VAGRALPSSRGRDLGVGFFVLLGLLSLAYLSFRVGGLQTRGKGGFELRAYFDEIGGLTERAPVRIAGVPVGHVRSIRLEPDGYRALVILDVERSLSLPVDTTASIRTDGLLGNQFVALEPGGEDELLASGDEVSPTESALNLEKLIGTLVHGGEGSANVDEE
jgi:phospholipid/cholesterol/gamma-HCH transport system substrate-binding protein